MSTSQQDEYEQYITSNMVELVQTLCVSAIIDHLLSHRLVTMEERARLMQCSTEQARSRMLLCEILPYKGNDVVGRLCNVLFDAGQQHIIREVLRKEVGQTHVVQRLTTTGNTRGIGRDPQVAAPDVGEMEMLKDQVVQLDREKRKVTVQLEKELCTAREEIRKAKEEASQARQETGQAKQEMKKAKIEAKGERLKNTALEYEKSRCPASHYHQTLKTTDVVCCCSAGVTLRSETRRKDSKDGGPHSAKNSANRVNVWSWASASDLRCDRTVVLLGRTGAGKSTCANVLADETDLFKASCGSTSKTYEMQREIVSVDWSNKTYKVKIVDTIGIGNTRLSENEVLHRLALICHECCDGINAVLFLVKNFFEDKEADAWDIIKQVLFGEEIVDYTAIVKTAFEEFENSEATEADRRELEEEDEAAKRILPGIKHFIYVDNPLLVYGPMSLAARASSRKKLLTHIIEKCENVFQPPTLREAQQRFSVHAQKLEEVKEKEKKLEELKRQKAEAKAEMEKNMRMAVERIAAEKAATRKGAAEEFVGSVVGATGRLIDRRASTRVVDTVKGCSVM